MQSIPQLKTVAILAAGLGLRLSSVIGEVPKGLQIGGVGLLQRSIELLAGLSRMVTENILTLAEVQQLSKQIERLNLKDKLSNNLTKEVVRQRQLVEEAREEIHTTLPTP